MRIVISSNYHQRLFLLFVTGHSVLMTHRPMRVFKNHSAETTAMDCLNLKAVLRNREEGVADTLAGAVYDQESEAI